jgi:uncharacterized protein (DUF1800 family)
MNWTRRQFMAAGSAALLAGCPQAGQWLSVLPAQSDPAPWVAPHDQQSTQLARLAGRISFGLRPSDLSRVAAMGFEQYLEEQLAPEDIPDDVADWHLRRLDHLRMVPGDLFEYKEDVLLREMTRATLLRAVYSRRQLHEVMVQFWTDHFSIDSSKGDCRWLKATDDREVIRKHALGNFRALLGASAVSPAMLWYLDGRTNRVSGLDRQPNENYARELLELHTLGVDGGYSQQDVMETARCLTGWTVRYEELFQRGKVAFHARQHDDGPKEVLDQLIPGGLGRRDLDVVLDLVALHPATARHLAVKLCRAFVAEEPAPSAVDAVGGAFLGSGGDIKTTLRALFTSRDFQEASTPRLKRPFHFIASALRATGAETDCGAPHFEYLVRMGHAPFQFPTPDGYPVEEAPWMGTLMWRWRFAMELASHALPGTKVNWQRLREGFGGPTRLTQHLLARADVGVEQESVLGAGLAPALLLATPAFQRY